MTREESAEMFNLLKASGVPIADLDVTVMQAWREWITTLGLDDFGTWVTSLLMSGVLVLIVWLIFAFISETLESKSKSGDSQRKSKVRRGLLLITFWMASWFLISSISGAKGTIAALNSVDTIKSLSAYYDIPEESLSDLLPPPMSTGPLQAVETGSHPRLVGTLEALVMKDSNGEITAIPNVLIFNDGDNNITMQVRESEAAPMIPLEEVLSTK